MIDTWGSPIREKVGERLPFLAPKDRQLNPMPFYEDQTIGWGNPAPYSHEKMMDEAIMSVNQIA